MENCFLEARKNYTASPDTSMFYMHTHEMYEIFCFLSGDARYYVEGSVYQLKPGDVLVMKKAEAHSLLIDSIRPYERIVINFDINAYLGEDREKIEKFLDRRPLGTGNLYSGSHRKDLPWRYYLTKICTEESKAGKRLYLSVLLNEMYSVGLPEPEENNLKDNFIEIVAYINDNLFEHIDLSVICQRFYISKTQLNRKFRKLIGTTVWEYITTKRLLQAKALLQKGTQPNQVYLKCGFNDYTSFYRAYKLHFGVNPRTDYVRHERET